VGRRVRLHLFDTHTLLWSFHDPSRLSPLAVRIVKKGDFLVSPANLWEMILKMGRPGAVVKNPGAWWRQYVEQQNVRVLPITTDAVMRVQYLPPIHHDPFDRILIAQAAAANIPLVTADAAILRYSPSHVTAVW